MVGRIGARELLQALAGLFPALRGAAQGLVILEREVALRRGAAGGLLVALDRFLALAAARELARLLELLAGAAAGDELRQPRYQRRAGLGLLQPLEVGARRIGPPRLGLGHAHAVQRLGLVGIEAKDFLPRFGGAIAAAALLPVLALVHQQFDRVLLGGGGCAERGQQAQHERFRAQLPGAWRPHGNGRASVHGRALADQHAFSHSSSSCPEGANR
ncbi:hypothetical protein D9M72_543780 [compost metagenome]